MNKYQKNNCSRISNETSICIPILVPLYGLAIKSFLYKYNEDNKIIPILDAQMLSHCNGDLDVNDIANILGVDKEFVLLRLRRYELLNMIIFLTKKNSKNETQNIVIVEPHSDDAYLSMGGTLLQLRLVGFPIYFFNVFSRASHIRRKAKEFIVKNFTMYSDNLASLDFNEAYIKLRKCESEVFAKYLSAECKFLDYKDAEIYKNSQGEHYIRNEQYNLKKEILNRFVYETKKLNHYIVFCPLSIGEHIDHEIIFHTLAEWSNEARIKTNIIFYEDMPYAMYETSIEEIIYNKLEKYGFNIRGVYNEITNVVKEKSYVSGIFQSQFPAARSFLSRYSLSLGKSKAVKEAASSHTLKYFERFWMDYNTIFPNIKMNSVI